MERIPDVSPEVPPATWRIVLSALGRLPQRSLSRSFGRIADLWIPPPLRPTVLGGFARAVGIDLAEAEGRFNDYPTLNAFFVRRLRPGVREWPGSESAVASPVDGVVGQLGRVRRGEAVQAKGHHYSVSELLGDGEEAERYDGGCFVTIYLSPRHYHRIHTPLPGTIPRADYIPGALLPVNAPAVMHVPGLFARNERLVCHLETAIGRVAVVAVGAYNVGRISAAFDPTWGGTGREPWVTNRPRPAPLERRYDPPANVGIGDEIMAFHLGSTIVLLLEGGWKTGDHIRPGVEVRVGEPLGG
jgi:phosphatidylserine decarboxylase